MKRSILFALVTLFGLVHGVHAQAPVISQLNPDSGFDRDTVVISGTNFSPVPSENTVKFRDKVATVTAASTTELTVIVPDGALSGDVTVTVNSVTSNGVFFGVVLETGFAQISHIHFDPSLPNVLYVADRGADEVWEITVNTDRSRQKRLLATYDLPTGLDQDAGKWLYYGDGNSTETDGRIERTHPDAVPVSEMFRENIEEPSRCACVAVNPNEYPDVAYYCDRYTHVIYRVPKDVSQPVTEYQSSFYFEFIGGAVFNNLNQLFWTAQSFTGTGVVYRSNPRTIIATRPKIGFAEPNLAGLDIWSKSAAITYYAVAERGFSKVTCDDTNPTTPNNPSIVAESSQLLEPSDVAWAEDAVSGSFIYVSEWVAGGRILKFPIPLGCSDPCASVPTTVAHPIDDELSLSNVYGQSNSVLCYRGTFHYTLLQDAYVTLKLIIGPDEFLLIDHQLRRYDPVHPEVEEQIDTVVVPGPGEYAFLFEAESAVCPGRMDTQSGPVYVTGEALYSLPVGHTFVKNVDVSDGHLVLQRQDLYVPDRGFPIEFVRTYSSSGLPEPGPLGPGWTHNYNVRLHVGDCSGATYCTVVGGDGTGQTFRKDGANYVAQAGYFGTLTHLDGPPAEYVFTTKYGVKYHFWDPDDPPNPDLREAANLFSIVDLNDNTLSFTYDEFPDTNERVLVTVSDGRGYTLNFTYEEPPLSCPYSKHRLTRVDGPFPDIIVEFTYDEQGALEDATRGLRTEEYEYRYDTEPKPHTFWYNMLTFRDPEHNETTFAYYAESDPFPGDPVPRKYEYVKTVTEGANDSQAPPIITEFLYSGAPRTTTVTTDGCPYHAVYTINDYMAVTELDETLGSDHLITSYVWDPDLIVITDETDAEGLLTHYDYDSNGNVTRKTITTTAPLTYYQAPAAPPDEDFVYPPLGTAQTNQVVWQYTYSTDYSRLLDETDPHNVVTSYEYDTRGNLTKKIEAEGSIDKTTTYERNSTTYEITKVTDPNAYDTTFPFYDDHGNYLVEEKAVGPTTIATHYDYQHHNRLTHQYDTVGRDTIYVYDSLDRLTNETREGGPNDDSRTYTYYENGELETVSTASPARMVTYYRDSLNRVREIEDSEHPLHNYVVHYNTCGNKLDETDHAGVQFERTYDQVNRLETTAIVGPLDPGPTGVIAQYEYNKVGVKTAEVDIHGARTVFVPDGLYRVTEVQYPQVTKPGPDVHDYAAHTFYDLAGNVTVECDRNDHCSPTRYDDLYRVIQQWDAEKNEVAYQYDANGNRLSEQHSNGLDITWDPYDALNRPTARRVHVPNEIGPPRPDNPGQPHVISIGNQDHIWTYEYEDTAVHRETVTLETPVDPRRLQTKLHRDPLDRVYETDTDPPPGLNLQEFREYDGNGNLTRLEDWDRFVTEYEYDGRNRLTLVTHPAVPQDEIPTMRSFTEGYSYDGHDQVEEYRDKNGVVFKTGYDNTGRVIRESVMEGLNEVNLRTYEYNDPQNTITIRDNALHTTVEHLDELGRLYREDDPLLHPLRHTYDGEDRIATEDRKGYRTEYVFDAIHRVTETTYLGAGPTGGDLTVSTVYNDPLNEVIETDARGIVTREKSDALGRLVFVERGSPPVYPRQLEYDEAGKVVLERDANGNDTHYEFDHANRTTKMTEGWGSPVSADTTYLYDPATEHSIETKDGRAAQYSEKTKYDGLRRTWYAENGENDVTRTYFDGNDNPILQIDPRGAKTSYEYEELGRPERILTDELGEFIFAYDNDRNLTGRRDAENNAVTYEYDERDLTRKVKQCTVKSAAPTCGGAEKITEYQHDPNGNVTTITDPNGNDTVRGYDFFNRLETWSQDNGETHYPATREITYTYDENGNLDFVLRHADNGGGTWNDFTTDPAYDGLDRMYQATEENGILLEYGYDSQGNQTRVVSNTLPSDYEYDARNRITKVRTDIDGPGAPTYEAGYQYYPDSLPKLATYTTAGPSVTSQYQYDEADRVTLIDHRAGATPLSKYEYTYDRGSNRTQMIETQGGAPETTLYQYNFMNRPFSINSPDGIFLYGYDKAGNRTSFQEPNLGGGPPLQQLSYTYNALNQLTYVDDLVDPARFVEYQYDDNGNLTVKHGTYDLPGPYQFGGFINTFAYAYDSRDRMRESEVWVAYVPAPDYIGCQEIDYDYQGRQFRVKDSFMGYEIGQVYDGLDLMMQVDVNGVADPNYFAYGPAGLYSTHRAPQGQRFALHDSLGSVVNLLDNAGDLDATYLYDPFGGFRDGLVSDIQSTYSKLSYTGKLYNPGLGFYDYHARFMDPTVGRFTTQDVLEGDFLAPMTLNRYIYARSNPLYFVDPTGLESLGQLIHGYTEEAWAPEARWWTIPIALGGEAVYATFEFASAGAVGKIGTSQERMERGKISGSEYTAEVCGDTATFAATTLVGGAVGKYAAGRAIGLGANVRWAGTLAGSAGTLAATATADVLEVDVLGTRDEYTSVGGYAGGVFLGGAFGYREGLKIETAAHVRRPSVRVNLLDPVDLGDTASRAFSPRSGGRMQGASWHRAAEAIEFGRSAPAGPGSGLSSRYGLAGRGPLAEAVHETASLTEAKELVRTHRELVRLVEETEQIFQASGERVLQRGELAAIRRNAGSRETFEGTARHRIFNDLLAQRQRAGGLTKLRWTPQGATGIDLYQGTRFGFDLTTAKAWPAHFRTHGAYYDILIPLYYR